MENVKSQRPSTSERLATAHCELVDLTTPDDLYQAWQLDNAIFSKDRESFVGEDVRQPAVAFEDYLWAASKGHILGLRTEGHPNMPDGSLIGVAGIIMTDDPACTEPLIQNLYTEDTYLWVNCVDEKFRGLGLGGLLLDVRLDRARAAGKRRVISVVHPTNIASQNNMYSRGFIAVDSLEAYTMEDDEGIRFTIVNQDIHNPFWVQENTKKLLPSVIEISEDNITDLEKQFVIDPETTAYGFRPDGHLRVASFYQILGLLRASTCIQRASRSPTEPGIIQYHMAAYTDLRHMRPVVHYPYASLLEAYHAKMSAITSSPHLWTLHAESVLPTLQYGPFGKIVHFEVSEKDELHINQNAENLAFIDWLTQYHQNLQSDIPASEVLPPFRRTGALNRKAVDKVMFDFLCQEQRMLLELTTKLPAWHPVLAEVKRMQLAAKSLPDTKELGAQNAELYRVFARYPLEKLHYDLQFDSKIDSMIAYTLGRSLSMLSGLGASLRSNLGKN